jgi:hypothetical protein
VDGASAKGDGVLTEGREMRHREIRRDLAPGHHVGNSNPPAMTGQKGKHNNNYYYYYLYL